MGNSLCTSVYHIRNKTVAPADTYGWDAVCGGADHIKGGIAYHDRIIQFPDNTQQIRNDLSLFIPASIHGCAGNDLKVRGKPKFVQNLNGGCFRL